MNKLKMLSACLLSTILNLIIVAPSSRADQVIGNVDTHGLFIKDKLRVEQFDDPGLGGISCYITLQYRPIEIEDASDVAMSCLQVGPIVGTPSSQADIFSQKKSWFIKSLRVDRLFDAKRNTVVYLAYTKSLGSRNDAHAISTVLINNN